MDASDFVEPFSDVTVTDRPPIRLAVLISGAGTTLQNLIDKIRTGRLNAVIEVVVASKPNIAGIDRAINAGLRVVVCQPKQFPTPHLFNQCVFASCKDANLMCLAGWLTLLDVPDQWTGRVINIHPSLLPEFGGKGMFGRRVHQAVLDAGRAVSGCTVHYVDQSYDTGRIILQRTCLVVERDTAESLAARVFEQEKIAYPEAIRLHASTSIQPG